MKTTLEIWLPIKNYEGLYEVSNQGKIRNVKTGKFLKQHLRGRKNLEYRFVRLSKGGVIKNYYVHCLQAIAFIPNPLNLPQVNHKDECRTNNFIYINPDGTVDFEKSNLEFCDAKYNCRFGSRIERIIKKTSKRLAQYSLDGVLISTYQSLHDASRQTGIDYRNISMCCHGKRKSAGGFIWRYLE